MTMFGNTIEKSLKTVPADTFDLRVSSGFWSFVQHLVTIW